MSSASSSLRSSPYGSTSDLNEYNDERNEDEIYTDKPRKSRVKRTAGFDNEEAEQFILKAQQESGEFTQDYQEFRNRNQGHTRRIHDMMSQFDDARMRLDRLLQRNSLTRDYYSNNDFSSSRYSPMNMMSQRSSMDIGRVGANRSGESSPRQLHKSELMVNPTVPNKIPVFEAVSLTVVVDEEQVER